MLHELTIYKTVKYKLGSNELNLGFLEQNKEALKKEYKENQKEKKDDNQIDSSKVNSSEWSWVTSDT